MGTYWQRRRERADKRLEKSERAVARRAEALYREELKRLDKEIAAFYAEFPEGSVSAYREAMGKLPPDEEQMLWRDCDRFAEEHPEAAWMVPVRKGMHRLTRLEGLQHSARLGLAKATANTETLLPRHFEEAAREAARAVADTLGFNTYDEGAVRRFIGTEWADGKSYSARIWDNAAKLAEYVSGDMAKALARGDGYDRMRGEIAKRFAGQSVSNIMRVVQTEGTYVSRQVQGEEMRRAGFDSYYIDSLNDRRTCPTCRAISERSHREPFRFEDARPGENYPPLHPRCRCEVNPAVDDWADFIKGGDGRPQERARVAERFGAALGSKSGKVPGLPPASIVHEEHYDPKDKRRIRKFVERHLRELLGADVEHSYSLQADGTVMHAVGTAENVSLEGVEMTGAVVLHNHAGKDAETFSDTDFYELCAHSDAAAFVLVAGGKWYMMEPRDGLRESDLFEAYEGIEISSLNDSNVNHELLKAVSKNGKIRYLWGDIRT